MQQVFLGVEKGRLEKFRQESEATYLLSSIFKYVAENMQVVSLQRYSWIQGWGICPKGQKTGAQKCTSSMVTQDFNPKKQRPGDTEVRRPGQLSLYGLLAPNSSVSIRSEERAGIGVRVCPAQ